MSDSKKSCSNYLRKTCTDGETENKVANKNIKVRKIHNACDYLAAGKKKEREKIIEIAAI